MQTYIDLDVKRTAYLAGLVIGTGVVATVLFWLIFGFNKWQQDLTTASQLMTAATVIPMAQAPPPQTATGQFVCTVHGAVGLPAYDAAGMPHCPICGQVMSFNPLGSTNLTQAAAG